MNNVFGIDTVIYNFQNDKGGDVFLPYIGYYLPTAGIHLFTPQNYHQMHNQESTISGKQVAMHIKDHNIVISINSGTSKLRMIQSPAVSAEEQREIGHIFLELRDLPVMYSLF